MSMCKGLNIMAILVHTAIVMYLHISQCVLLIICNYCDMLINNMPLKLLEFQLDKGFLKRTIFLKVLLIHDSFCESDGILGASCIHWNKGQYFGDSGRR